MIHLKKQHGTNHISPLGLICITHVLKLNAYLSLHLGLHEQGFVLCCFFCLFGAKELTVYFYLFQAQLKIAPTPPLPLKSLTFISCQPLIE